MLLSITIEFHGNNKKDWLPTWNICLSKGIFEVNILTLQTWSKLKKWHQPYCVPLYHWQVQIQGFRIQYPLDMLSHKILYVELPDITIRFPLTLEGPYSYKYIVIINIYLWNLFPIKYDVLIKILPWNHLSCVLY